MLFQLPVRIKSADPANLGTADCAFFGHGDDGCDYAVKNVTSGVYTPHSEWFCKYLGDAVGIASPECRIVEYKGKTGFGSRWESGHHPDDWVTRMSNGEIEKERVAPILSRIFAFDLFINNVDRHLTNYIVRPQRDGKWSFLAFDHSRAWIATGWPLADAPMATSITTRSNFSLINRLLGGLLDTTEALLVTDHIKNVELEHVTTILDQQPVDWLSDNDRNAILTFWDSDNRLLRIERIEEGFKNGEYV